MNVEFYQDIKKAISSFVVLPPDTLHIYIGLLMLLVSVFVFRKGLASYWVLIPGLVFSLVMECFDILHYIDLYDLVLWKESLHDFFHTNFIPLVLVILFRFGRNFLFPPVSADPL